MWLQHLLQAGRRPLPPGTVEMDLPLDIQAAQRLAFWMDNAFVIPVIGKRIGWDAITGLFPGAGDLVTALIGIYMVYVGYRHGLPWPLLVRMGVNLALDAAIGVIPLVGDLADAGFKAHARNAALLAAGYRRQAPPQTVTLNVGHRHVPNKNP